MVKTAGGGASGGLHLPRLDDLDLRQRGPRRLQVNKQLINSLTMWSIYQGPGPSRWLLPRQVDYVNTRLTICQHTFDRVVICQHTFDHMIILIDDIGHNRR